jgi:hypothetical protein
MRRNSFLLVTALLLAACEGPMGPQGPIGPAGPQGPPPQRQQFIVQANSLGDATFNLPASVGTDRNRPPAIICLTASSQTSGTWLLVSTDDVTAKCGLTFNTTTNTWTAVMLDTAPGWYALFIVIF